LLPACLLTVGDESYPALCGDTVTCHPDPLNYYRVAGKYTTDFTGLRILGVAKDGHVMYGPYDQNGELWDCNDHDICNGRYFSEMDGSYAYVMTGTHPYTIGCWGPGPEQLYY